MVLVDVLAATVVAEIRQSNLWPFSKDANTSAGSLHEKQVSAYDKLTKNNPHRLYTIGGIGLDPDKRRKIEQL
jgi:hypothetical protein